MDEYDPIEMEEVKCYPPGFTKWDKLVVTLPAHGTLADAAAQLKEDHGLTHTSISHAACGREGQGSGQSVWASDVYGSAALKAATVARFSMTVSL